jgi:hypothetical protein
MNREEIIHMALAAGYTGYDSQSERLHEFAALVSAHERERCAQVCEDHFMSDGHWCAQAIRKGEK